MATQSTASPNSIAADAKSQELPTSPDLANASATIKSVEGDGKIAQTSSGETSTDAFIKAITAPQEQPMREEQIQNAVKFLSHPKVRGSPVVYRRSFLEKKGLTREEIDEAFRRVPDPPPTTAGTETAKTAQEKTSVAVPSQVPSPTIQTTLAPAQPPSLRSKLRWPYIVLAVGVLATSGAGTAVLFKNAVIPRLKAWIRKVVKEEDDSLKKEKLGPGPAEEAAEAAKAAASAAAVVAKACQDLLASRNEEKKYFETFAGLLDTQVKEMKSMGSAIRGLESLRESVPQPDRRKGEIHYVSGTASNARSSLTSDQSDSRISPMNPQGWNVNGTVDNSVRPSAAPPSTESSSVPYPKSFVEIMSMVQRGEKPPGIKDINDMPPNPNQPPSNPRLAPRAKPWETAAQAQPIPGYNQASDSELNKQISQVNGDSLDWSEQTSWKQKVSDVEESKVSSYGIGSKNWPGREWVPPQTPSVAIPESAAAIRKPKPKPPQPPPTSATTASDPPAKVEDNENSQVGISEANQVSEITVEEVNGV
ncbi:peroxin 14 isoform X2 [Wolffia australiana]